MMLTRNIYKNRKVRFSVYHLPVILYAAIIIAISSIRSLPAPELGGLVLDKLAHFVEYALFAFLTFRSFSHLSPTIRAGTAALLSLLFLVCFAALDEYYQQYVVGRFADAYDLLSDTFGAAIVLAYLWFRQRYIKAPQKS